MLISTGGTVIRMPVDEVKRLGRATQGVIVMRLRGDERVSALAPVVESDDDEPGIELAPDIAPDIAIAPVDPAGNGTAPEE
jgi:DNA gyrase subunit A